MCAKLATQKRSIADPVLLFNNLQIRALQQLEAHFDCELNVYMQTIS